ncbi:MAG: glycosyltransferase family 4 protein [Candidatus Zixiibacteriota bacterium]
MNIIYIHQYFNTPAMPGSTRSYEMARRLVKEGHQVTMITSSQSSQKRKKRKFTIENGIRVFWLPVSYSNKMPFFRRILSFFQFSYLALLKASRLNGDLVFATSTPLTIAVPAIMISKTRHIPMVFEIRDLWPEIPIAIGALKSKLSILISRWLERLAYSASARIIALSPGMKPGIMKSGYPGKNIVTIPNFSDLKQFYVSSSIGKEFRNQYPWLKNRPLVVYAGAIGIINGLSYLVEIAGRMLELNSEVRFIIVGEGIEKEPVLKLAKVEGVFESNLFFLDPIPKSEIPALYSAANVVTSLVINLKELRHNSANKFFDGLAAGKPIMINYGGWQKQLLVNNQAGLVVPENDPLTAGDRLNRLIQTPNKLLEMGQNALKLAENNFNVELLFEKFNRTLRAAYLEYYSQ